MGWVIWDNHTSFETWVPIRGKHFLQNWGIYKMCDIQISDKISKNISHGNAIFSALTPC